ncbi:hypothetical protein RBU61_11940 [Tissierella sp. MB52-C2]|uniref:hypothetical protein n=1 Tax=Tissierella sp. MB52-C2 TaxID=3070999 RepID=UPI00280ABF06|nr:hypothetical protein [Tissierella sp. MB52-C2]WMM23635.1 hypothetical protein RBU61_11940 [Tissierella sp. MB52-C2]
MEKNLDRLLLNLFQEDYIKNNTYTYLSQLGVVTIKSLMPMKEEVAVRIDYKRFIEEFKLWVSYRNGENPSLLNIQGRVDPSIYWDEEDNSIVSRIIPIVLSNQNYEIVEEEIIKNVLFTSGNLKVLFEWISISYLLYEIIYSKIENKLLDKLKEIIIGFSQVDYMRKYERHYRIGIEDYKGNFSVDFEREKIYLLNMLNGIENLRYPNLVDLTNIFNKEEPKTTIGEIVYRFLYELDTEYSLPKFYMNLGEYIINLRKSRIDPEQLKIEKYILPDIFSFKEGEVFFHSLLKKSKVIKKEVKNNVLTSLVQTRTGMYSFKK